MPGFPKTLLIKSVLVILVCLIAFSIYFSPVLLAGKLLAPGDDLTEFLPTFFSQRYVWADIMLCGFPQAADLQAQFWYPLSWLATCTVAGWNLTILLPYALAAAFTYGYIYSLIKTKAASALGALIFSTSGFLIGNLRHLTMLHAACWMPLGIWSISELKKRVSPFWFFVLSIDTALMALAGHSQSLGYALTLMGTFTLMLSCHFEDQRLKIDFRFVWFCFLAVFLGLGISAVQLLPTLALIATTERLAHGLDFYNYFRFSPFEYLLFFFPCLLGIDESTIYRLDFVGPANFVSACCYIGLLPLMLIPLAFRSNIEQKQLWFWLCVTVICAFLVLGDLSWIGQLAYYYPPYKIFRVPSRHFLEMSFAIAMLASFGLHAIRCKLVTKRALVIVIAASVFVFACAFLVAILLLPAIAQSAAELHQAVNMNVFANPSLTMPIAALVASIAVLIAIARRPESHLRLIAFLLVACLDLASFGQFCEWKTSACAPSFIQIPDYAVKYRQSLRASSQRAANVRGNGGSPFELPSNLSALWGVPTINSYQPLLSNRAKRFFCMFAGGFINCDLGEANDHSLDVAAVRYVFVPKFAVYNPFTSISKNTTKWHQVEELPSVYVYENMAAMPRVWLVPKVEQKNPDESIIVIHTSPNFDPHKLAFVEEPIELGPGDSSTDIAKLVAVDNGSMTVSTTSKATRLLVTSDAYYPGWEAQIDGKPAHIYQTDYLFRGVVVPTGEHTVIFQYKPRSLAIGIAASLVSLSFLALTYLYLRRTTRVRP